ncbi:lysis system i-spanin subunit Rz [Escherichia coli]
MLLRSMQKYTKELADAKAENDALRRKLDNGGRVLVKGKMPCAILSQNLQRLRHGQ